LFQCKCTTLYRKIANNSQENNISNNLIDDDLDKRDIIITHSEKTLPDTISLTSLTSIESEPPPLPDTIPPFLPEISVNQQLSDCEVRLHLPEMLEAHSGLVPRIEFIYTRYEVNIYTRYMRSIFIPGMRSIFIPGI
jgi:hypothetical protein